MSDPEPPEKKPIIKLLPVSVSEKGRGVFVQQNPQSSGHVHGPGCGHENHASPPPEAPPAHDGHVYDESGAHDHPTPPPASSGSGHVHSASCGHNHTPKSSSGGGVHYHGDTPCSHSHAPSGGTHEPHLPKGKSNAGWWVAGIVAAVGVGAYFVNEYGKKSENTKENEDNSANWKQRISTENKGRKRLL